MRLLTNNDRIVTKITVFFSVILRLILNALLILLALALIIGVVKSGYDLFSSLREPLDAVLQRVLLDTVFIVALLEISITILGYLKDGRVHVRYIVDTILIIMLNEIVALWFRHPKLQDMIGIAVIVLTLAAIRLIVTRLAPKDDNL